MSDEKFKAIEGSISRLSSEVENHLKDGWSLHGTVIESIDKITTIPIYIQFLYREEKSDSPPETYAEQYTREQRESLQKLKDVVRRKNKSKIYHMFSVRANFLIEPHEMVGIDKIYTADTTSNSEQGWVYRFDILSRDGEDAREFLVSLLEPQLTSDMNWYNITEIKLLND